MAAAACSKHEAVNSHFKKWDILSTKYRHGVARHGDTFSAIANIVQVSLMLSREYQAYEINNEDDQLFNAAGTLLV